MEVGIVDNISLERGGAMLMRLDNHKGYLEDALTAASAKALDAKLAAKAEARFVELGLLENQNEDEGEIMLLAMILLQLHGVKLPLGTSVHSSDLLHKKKRQRTSPEQLAILEQIFQTDKMPNQQTRVQLADQLGMSSRRVQIWFQNKRAKVKRNVSRSSDGLDIPSPSSPLDSSQSPSSPTEECPSLNCSSSSISIASPSATSPINPQSPPPVSPLSSSKKLPDSVPSSVTATSTKLPLQTSSPLPSIATPFSSTQLQFSLSSFESQLQMLPNEYTTMRFQTLLKN